MTEQRALDCTLCWEEDNAVRGIPGPISDTGLQTIGRYQYSDNAESTDMYNWIAAM